MALISRLDFVFLEDREGFKASSERHNKTAYLFYDYFAECEIGV